jgi:hypothetical protein
MRAQLGHPAISRPTAEGSATATLAARLAVLPMTSRVHGSKPLRLAWRESRSRDIDEAAIIPSTEIGTRAAVHDVSAVSPNEEIHMLVRDNRRDYRQHDHTQGRRPSDRPLGAALFFGRHADQPSTLSSTSAATLSWTSPGFRSFDRHLTVAGGHDATVWRAPVRVRAKTASAMSSASGRVCR